MQNASLAQEGMDASDATLYLSYLLSLDLILYIF